MATPDIKGGAIKFVPSLLVSTQVAVTTDSAIYTVPANTAVKLTHGTVANVSGGPVTVGLSLVKSGGTIGDGTHKVIPDVYVLNAGDSLSLQDYIADAMLGDGDAIVLHCGTANAIDVVISGVVMS